MMMNTETQHLTNTTLATLEKEKASILEKKELAKKYLNAILETQVYIKTCDSYFTPVLVKFEASETANREIKFHDLFEEYNHDEDVPIKNRIELQQFMNAKYINRIETYFQETSKMLQEITKSTEKMDASYQNVEKVLNKLQPEFLAEYFKANSDSPDVEKLKTKIQKIEDLNTFKEKYVKFLNDFNSNFNIYSTEFDNDYWTGVLKKL